MRILLILSWLALLLTGCDSAEFKEKIQKDLDVANPNGDRGFCFYLPQSKTEIYPYTSINTPPSSDRLSNDELNHSLRVFAQMGLFTEEPAGEDGGKPIYRYDLTPLGKHHFYHQSFADGFCFGRIVVLSIEEKYDETTYLFRKTKQVYFDFAIENMPDDWLQTNMPLIRELYSGRMVNVLKQKQERYSVPFEKKTGDKEWHILNGIQIRLGFFLARSAKIKRIIINKG